MRLRHIIFGAFLFVSWAPVMVFTTWSYDTAFRNEIGAVKEKHLLLAQYLTRALSRYATDLDVVFRTVSGELLEGHGPLKFRDLLSGLHFRHVCRVGEGRRLVAVYCADGCPQAAAFPADVYQALEPTIAAARRSPGTVVFSGVFANPAGAPSIYLVRTLPGGDIAIGEIATTYLAQLQSSVAFGTRGHAAIVDAAGHIIAHPRADWVREMHDIQWIDIVQRMMRGETGVAQFYSPAIGADVVAGYAAVPDVGWGVMVPQPVSELLESARLVAFGAILLGLFALVATGLASWFLARYLDRALAPVLLAARRNAEGEIGAEAVGLPRRAPREARELFDAFNVMARRISQAFQAEREARQAARSERDNNDAKTQFLAQVSHEFRTPLNAILGFSEVMRDQLFGPIGNTRYRDYADSIHRSGLHLLGLIDDVLDISRADLGRAKPREEWVSVSELVEDATSIVNEAHRAEVHERAVSIPGDLPRVRVDRQMMRQVLINLLSNSEKFTPEGGRVAVSARLGRDGRMTIAVTDTGIGIAAKDIERVLAPFGRVTTGQAATKPGTGLGLTLAKSLTELHGGELLLDSDYGVGTTVRVRLPADRVEGAQRHDAVMPLRSFA